jgi:glycosyltransferase involved in cell wall biosynthesis
MKKIFYWSPYLSNVATIRNVIDSAFSLAKYSKGSYKPYIIDAMGEWSNKNNGILEKDLGYIKLSNFKLNLPISGFLKSRAISVFIFFSSIVPLFHLLKKEKPSYLIIHLLTSIPLTLLMLFNFKTKFVLRISGLPRLNFFRKFLWKIVSKKLFLVTCPTNETLDNIIKTKIFDESKVVLLPDPIINVAEILKKNKKNIQDKKLKKNYFLNIGRLTKQKNQQLLIKLFYRFNTVNENYYLYIIGEGEEKETLQKQINDLSLQDRIFLLGHQNNVFPYISLSRAIISTSLWEDPGAVMIEAAFCNKTVISSDCISGPKEFLMNNKAGYLFKNGNLESIFETFKDYVKEKPEKIHEMKILAKKNSRKYSLFSHFIFLKNFLT